MLRTAEPQWQITFKSDESLKTEAYLGMRRFSAVVLLVDLARNTHVIQSDLIVEVRSMQTLASRQNFACSWFGHSCWSRSPLLLRRIQIGLTRRAPRAHLFPRRADLVCDTNGVRRDIPWALSRVGPQSGTQLR
jgi:hypothetical protein